MKKKLVASFLMGVLCIITIFGCSSNNEETKETEQVEETEPKRILK